MKSVGKLFIVSGPSGVGKATVIDKLLEKEELNLSACKTITSRPPRGGKSDDQYFFTNATKFERMIRDRELLEYNFYNGNYYGTSKELLYEQLSQGKNVILEIDVNGALKIKEQIPSATTIFVYAKIEEIEARIRKRGENSEEEISERVATAREELTYKNSYDFCVENPQGESSKAASEIALIIKKKIE